MAQARHPGLISRSPYNSVKELSDNGIDACEEAGLAPELTVRGVDASGISVADNGPGLPAETIKSVLDYAVRVSSREAYVSPTRGAHTVRIGSPCGPATGQRRWLPNPVQLTPRHERRSDCPGRAGTELRRPELSGR